MSEIIKISNGVISAEISAMGAELISLMKDGFENIWDGNPEIWDGHAPILFPVCGQLKDGKFTYRGKEYFMDGHGFAKHSLFSGLGAETVGKAPSGSSCSFTTITCLKPDFSKIARTGLLPLP